MPSFARFCTNSLDHHDQYEACDNETLQQPRQRLSLTAQSRLRSAPGSAILARQRRTRPHARGLPRPAHFRGASQAEQRATGKSEKEVRGWASIPQTTFSLPSTDCIALPLQLRSISRANCTRDWKCTRFTIYLIACHTTAFLLSLILSIFVLSYRVLLAPSPYKLVQYATLGLLLIAIVTLILFFATGVYSEKIAYAYK